MKDKTLFKMFVTYLIFVIVGGGISIYKEQKREADIEKYIAELEAENVSLNKQINELTTSAKQGINIANNPEL